MTSKKSIPCTIMRGGTSKGLFFIQSDLPEDTDLRAKMLLDIMGSPDKKQIDGLGGSTSVTSKVAIISLSDREDADVNYTFAQVSVDKPIVSYKGNCGNISSAVGPFAIEKGLVPVSGDLTSVRIYNTNTDKVIISDVCTKGGFVNYQGDFSIAGVPGTAAPVKLHFVKPAGAVTNKLLPTGNPSDILDVPEVGKVEVSIVDAANPLAFISGKDIGLSPDILPTEIDSNPELLRKLELIRGAAAVKCGFIEDYTQSAVLSSTVPKLTIVFDAEDYKTSGGDLIRKDDIDIISKMMSMQKAHPTYAMTGAMCTVAAAAIKGTVVGKHLKSELPAETELKIGHPGGIIPAGVVSKTDDGVVSIEEAYGFRTANLLMDGSAYYFG